MSQFESNPDNVSADRRPKETVERILDNGRVLTDRFIQLRSGTKAPAQKWRDDGLGQAAKEVEKNYAIKCGDGLVVIDKDHPEKLPAELPPTFTVKSPHGDAERGHLYYRVEETVKNHREDWGDLQSNGSIVVGPGSTLDHNGYCGDDCALTGESVYEIVENRPIATLGRETIDAITTGAAEKTESEEQFQPVDDPDGDLVARAEANMRDFQSNCAGLAFNDLLDLLNGGTGSIDGLRRDDGDIDRDKADLEALWMLYGVMRYAHEDAGTARELAYIAYTHYCKEMPHGKDGRKRKWLTRQESYRLNRLRAAVEGFDFGKWHKWRRRQSGDGFDEEDYRNWTNDYSDVCYDLMLAVIDIRCGLDPEYVSKVRGVDLSPPTNCHKIPPGGSPGRSCDSVDCDYPLTTQVKEDVLEIDSRSESTYKSVLQRLQRRGAVKIACIKEGVDYRVYPASLPDPPEAEYIRFEGEKQDPETAPEPAEEAPEPKIMTDGGTRQPEAKEDLERIRQAREGDVASTDGPEVFTCPIDGCSRTVVGNPAALRSHVRQSNDDAHRGLKLNSSLEPVERYKIESDLREQYVEKEKSQQEIADDWGCTRSTIQRWMNRHSIPRRSGMGGGANRVEYATFYTESSENGGYEKVGAYDSEKDSMVWTTVHQLLAIAEGENPEKVFSNGENQTHHRTGIPFDNRPTNVELLSREVHSRAHRRDEWGEDDGFPVLVTQRVQSEAEYRAMWGPGIPDSESEERESVYEPDDSWGPGVPG